MKARTTAALFILFLITIVSLFFSINNSVKAQEKPSADVISIKLDQILEGQKTILQKLNLMDEKLNKIESATNKL